MPAGASEVRPRDRFLALSTAVLAVVVTAIIGVSIWSARQIDAAASEVEHSTELVNSYRELRAAVSEQAFAEAGYRRSPGPASRARLESSLDGLVGAVEQLRMVGDPADQATAIHLLAINERYTAEIRDGLLATETMPTVRDDRVAGPALDAIFELTTTAITRLQDNVTTAVADQRATIRGVMLLLPIVLVGGTVVVLACWWLLVRRQRRLTDRAASSARDADHDPLTGLPNRRAVERHIDAALADPEPFGLLLIDLDGFKELNDTLGHLAGDQALEAIAARFADVVRAHDLAARLGGDEFAVVVRGTERLDGVASRLRDAARRPLALGNATWTLSASVGGALAGETDDRTALIRRADERLYAAKRAGRNRIVTDDACTPISTVGRNPIAPPAAIPTG